MKKIIVWVVLIIALVLFFKFSASSADFTEQADYLNSLNVLRGSANGYQLSRAPTRLEAAILVSRLMSGGEPSPEENLTHPFIDVPSWADRYVGFLYQKGITKGSSGHFFRPFDEVDADMYLTLLLRSLGYSEENGDFELKAVRTFASKIGILDDSMRKEIENSPFLRGHMAALTVEALACPGRFDQEGDDRGEPGGENGREETFLDKWIEINGLTDAAAEIGGLFTLCERLEAALDKTAALEKSEVRTSSSLTLLPGGVYSQDVVVKRQLNNGAFEAYSEINYDDAGKAGWSRLYYKSGTAYLDDSKDQKIKYQTEFETIFPDETPEKLSFGAGQILSHAETKKGENSKIELIIDGSLYDAKTDILNSEEKFPSEKTCGNLVFTMVINPEGFVDTQTLSFDFLWSSGEKKSYGIYLESRTFIKKGNYVPIRFPSFSDYQTVSAP